MIFLRKGTDYLVKINTDLLDIILYTALIVKKALA